MADPDNSGAQIKPLKQRYKIIAYVAAWIAALFATNPGGGLWPLAYIFPLGLAAVIDKHLANDGGWWVLIAGYAIYLIHGFFYFRSRTVRSTAILFGLLIILLVGNVAGCRQMLPAH